MSGSVDLQSENDELRERVRQLEGMLGQTFNATRELGLTPTENKILGLLLSRTSVVSRDAIHSVLYSDRPNDVPDLNVVNVFVSKLRRKLKPHDIQIMSERASGYYLTNATKAKLAEITQ